MNNKIPNIAYYNDDHSKSPTCTHELSIINGATWTLPSTWQELTREIEQGEDKIVFHIDMITKSGESINNFIHSVKTISKFIQNNKPIKIVVLITPTTTQHQVKELKDTNILGIGYDITYYSYEQAAETTSALIKGESYWPEHIINQLPIVEEKPISVYFRRGWKEYFNSLVNPEHILANPVTPWQSKMCDNWDELGDVLKLNTHQIIFHYEMIKSHGITIHEFISMIETLIKVSTTKKIPLAIAIEKNTPLSLVKEFQKCNVYGIIPTADSFGLDETYKGLEALFNRIPYWPKHILDQLPGAKKIVTQNTIKLTSRQAQIVNLISERGLTNKKIAQALNITESTVKIHVSAILKAYGVRTRTQLALAAIK